MIKAILIDDEVHCLDTLNILLTDYCPEVEVMELCPSPKKRVRSYRETRT
jgi:two-component system LytT family response regulator